MTQALQSQGVLPNFLVIGAQRCATSWLYFCLRDHPDIYVPYLKEVAFFDRFYDSGMDWYRRYFGPWKGQKAVGEVTPSYLMSLEAPERIARELENVRLIVTLRNPIERAFSQYRKHLRAGTVSSDFRAALKNDSDYIERGFYLRQLERYFKYFSRDRVLILLYEDISHDPLSHLKIIFRFLGVDENVVPRYTRQVLPSEALGGGMYTPVAAFSQFLRRSMGMGGLIDAFKKTPLLPLMDRLFQKFHRPAKGAAREESGAKSIDPETRKYLAGLYAQENERLARFLGRDLSVWK